jgi:hypothetical protein
VCSSDLPTSTWTGPGTTPVDTSQVGGGTWTDPGYTDQPPVDTSSVDGGAWTDPGSSDSSYAGGGAIPASMSPSRGRVTDDVPAHNNDTGESARLNAGEFVIPRHTVAWKGEKFFQDLIAKSKKERGGGTAKPQMKTPLPSQRGAISMGGSHG